MNFTFRESGHQQVAAFVSAKDLGDLLKVKVLLAGMGERETYSATMPKEETKRR